MKLRWRDLIFDLPDDAPPRLLGIGGDVGRAPERTEIRDGVLRVELPGRYTGAVLRVRRAA